ncbi:MAG: hypothetical protein QOE92_750 [Chloroflexota bacterium]|jgi:serine protease|nr:hypothetical protein [Chloroflexota bacterium]
MAAQVGAGAGLDPTARIEATDTQAVIHVMPTVAEALQQHPSDEALPLVGCTFQCPTHIKWHGGPIMTNPKVYITYWGWHGSDPDGEAGYLENFMRGIGGTPYGAIQTQYTGSNGRVGNPGSQLKGTWWDDTSTPSQTFTQASVAQEAQRAAQHFGYDPDANYYVATPHGTTDGGFGVNYCAYHGNTGGNVRFTFMPYMTDAGTGCGMNAVNSGSAGRLDGVSIVGGHEWAEAITDPDVATGWYDKFGDENADKCAWVIGPGQPQDIYTSTGRFAVQSEYSNQALHYAGKCVFQ